MPTLAPTDSAARDAAFSRASGSVTQPPKHGWRRRRVGEHVAFGDVIEIGFEPLRAAEEREVGQRVLGWRDGFDDRVWTPRKHPKKISPNNQISNSDPSKTS